MYGSVSNNQLRDQLQDESAVRRCSAVQSTRTAAKVGNGISLVRPSVRWSPQDLSLPMSPCVCPLLSCCSAKRQRSVASLENDASHARTLKS